MKQNEIIRIYGKNYKEMTVRLLEEAELKALIPDKGCTIGIKPNLVVPSPAKFGATTHTEIAAGIIEYLRKYGFNNILIAEGCWVGDRTSECFEYTGFRSLCDEYDIPFFNVQDNGSHIKDCGGMKLELSDVLNEIDFLINVPVLKGHCQVKMTCALKNIKGLVTDREKRRFHSLGIHKPVACLNSGIHQDFIVVDNICGDPSFEEGGNPLITDCIMAALDPVLTDAYACRQLGITPEDVPYISIAESLGAGCSDLSKALIRTIGGNGNAGLISDTSGILDVSYAAEEIEACSACYASLVPALLRLKEEGLLDKLDSKIAIGQGHRVKTGRLGVGDCTAGFDFCIKGCPPDKDEIYRSIKEYITKGDGRAAGKV